MGRNVRKPKRYATARMPGGWKMIKGSGNLCIGFAGGRKHIRQRRCDSSRNVQWRMIRYGNRYIIQNRSGYVMDLYAYKRHNGAHIYAWNRKNGNNQRWIFQSIGGGKYLIRNHHSKKCLDNTGRAQVNRHYHQWTCSKRNANQHFYIRNIRKAKKSKKNKKKSRAPAPKRNKNKRRSRAPKGNKKPKKNPSKKPKGKSGMANK